MAEKRRKGCKRCAARFKNKIIITDEASMISSRQMNSLLKITNKLEAKLVLVGDVRQLAAVEAGMKTAKMTEIVRQKDIYLKIAVYEIIKSDVQKGLMFKKLLKALGKTLLKRKGALRFLLRQHIVYG